MLEIKPGDTTLMRLRAVLLADLKKFDAAAEELQKLHKANPKDLLTTLQLGMLYNTMKQYDKSLAAYDDVLSQRPDDVAALRGRGDTLLNVGRRGDAIAAYEKAIALKPHNAGILNNYAWVLATAPEDKLRDGHKALAMAIDACKQTDYKEDYILSTLAAAYAEIGDFKSARKYAAQAVAAKPSRDAEPTRKDELQKELNSYTAHKPWRESLPEDSAAKPDEKKAEAGDNAGKKDQSQSDQPKKKKKKKKKSLPPPEEESP